MPKVQNAQVMRDHIFDVARSNKIAVIEKSPSYSAKAFIGLRGIQTPRIAGPRTYLTALHELGHILHPDGDPRKSSELLAEVAAWEWAFENSKIPVTDKLKADCWNKGLGTYYRHAVVRGVEIPWLLLEMAQMMGADTDSEAEAAMERNQKLGQAKIQRKLEDQKRARDLRVGYVGYFNDQIRPIYLRGTLVQVIEVRQSWVRVKIMEATGGSRFRQGMHTDCPARFID
jgi:hypothetical protein